MNTNEIHRGDIFYADLSPTIGCEQDGFRPVLVIQNDIGNDYSPTVVVAPISSQIKKVQLPTHVILPPELNLPEESMVMLEQIRTLDRVRLEDFIGKADCETMRSVNKAIQVSLGLIPPRAKPRPEPLILCLCSTCASSFYHSKDHNIRRVDPATKKKEPCDYCRLRLGYDYTISSRKGSRREELS